MMLTINVNVHVKNDDTALVLAELKALKEAVLTQSEKIAELTTRLDAATNEIASDLQALRDKLASVTDVDLAPLDASISRLEALGRDPENPIPTT